MSTSYGYVYVINGGSNTISVIDTTTNIVISTISDPSLNLPIDIAITPDYATALVTNQGNNIVSVIDLTKYTVKATISGFNTLYNVVISPNGNTAYISNEGGVQVIDLSTLQITNTIEIEVGQTNYNYPWALAITPDGNTLYVSTYVDNTVAVVDLTASPPSVTGVSGIGNWTLPEIIVPKTGSSAYIVNTNTNAILELDLTTNMIVDTIPLNLQGFNAPNSAAISSDDTQLFVTNTSTGGLMQVDLASDNSLTLIPCQYPSYDVVVTSDLQYAYVSSSANNAVIMIDLLSKTVVGNPIKVGSTPKRMVLSPGPIIPGSAYTYVLSYNAPLVVLDTNNAIMGTIAVPSGTIGMALSLDQQTLYTVSTNPGAGQNSVLNVISTATNAIVDTITLPASGTLTIVAVTATSVYVSLGANSSIYIVDISTSTISGQLTAPGGALIGGIAISPNEDYAYITNTLGSSIMVFDLGTNALTNTISFTGTPYGIVLSPDGSIAYVLNYYSPSGSITDLQAIVSVVTLSTGNVQAILLGQNLPVNISITPNGDTLYLGLINSAGTGGGVAGEVMVIDTATNAISTITVEQQSNTVAFVEPNGAYVYVGETNIIEVIDVSTGTITSQIPLNTTLGSNNTVSGIVFKTQ